MSEKNGNLDLGWHGTLQTVVSNLTKNAFYKNILIDSWKRNKWALFLLWTHVKGWVAFLFGSACSGIWNLEKHYENIPPTHFEYPLPAYLQNSLVLLIANGWVEGNHL